MKRKITRADAVKLRAAYRDGALFEELVVAHRLSRATLHRVLRGTHGACAVGDREPIARPPGRPPHFDAEEVERIRTLHRIGTSQQRLAIGYRVSRSLIGHVVNRTGAYR